MVFAQVLVFVLGLAVGSFLNTVIYRLALAQDTASKTHDREFIARSFPFALLRGRSYCPQCKHGLSWRDLIPVLSFVWLGGRCRYCKQRISWQYPIVEISSAVLFVAIFNQFPHFLIFETLYLFAVASLLIVLFVYDLQHYLLPDKILFLAIGTTVAYQIIVWVMHNWDLMRNLQLEMKNFGPFVNPLFAAFLAAAFFFTLYWVSRGRWMGFGDVKLAAFMGLFLGFPHIVVALFAAFFAGAIIGVGLIALRKKKLKSEIPFGPFLIGGTLVALVWGEEIVSLFFYGA